MYEKEFDDFGTIVQIEDFQNVCLDDYDSYLDTVIKFKGTKEDISVIYQKYKDQILNMILNNDGLQDRIMIEKIGAQRTVRHDKEIEETIDFQKIMTNIFQENTKFNHFEKRAKTIILLETAKLINCYGMQELTENSDKISKEIRLGIFDAKTNVYLPKTELEKIEKRINISEILGEESIPYIENYELLKERIQSLRDFTKKPNEMQQLDILIQQLNTVEALINQQDSGMLDLLKQCYSDYEKINREILLARLNNADKKVLDDPSDESLLLLHFIPDFTQTTDITQDEFFEKIVTNSIETYIETKYGRKYDAEIDSEEASELLMDYLNSRKNPFDLNLRIPLKNRYTNSSFHDVITKPHTKLSCSIAKIGHLHPHLNRKIAIGFSPVPINAIKTINRGYNNALDRFSFQQNSTSIPEVLEHIEKGGTNETLVDWTQIQPAYIMVVKDTEKIPEELLKIAEEYSNITGLPIQIYDQYEIERKKNNPEIAPNNHPIVNSYNSSTLAPFAQIRSKGLLQRIRNTIQTKILGLGGKQDEPNKW